MRSHANKLDRATLILAALIVLFVSAIPSHAQIIKDPNLQYRLITTVNEITTNMAFTGPDDILVLKKNTGEVVRVKNGAVGGPVLDVNVNSFSGRGLLGITLHPNFPTNGFVYLYYTKSATNNDVATNDSLLDNRVERYTWNGNALINPVLIVSLPADPIGLHVGGIVTFGPDGKLYAVMGYNDRNGKLQNNSAGAAPDDTGVVLRLNDDGTVPTDNPFLSQGGNLQKYFAYGIRNSFGMAFDPLTGRLWMTDNGDESYDEINLVLPGFNSGWSQLMGPQSRSPGATANLYVVPGSQYADPKFSWLESVAPTAIVFMNSPQLGPQYVNNAFVSDYNSGRLYRFQLNPARDGFVFQSPGLADLVADDETEVSEVLFGSSLGLLTDLKIGPDGKLYLLRLDGGIVVIERQLQSSPLAVTEFHVTPSGFDAHFNKPIDLSVLNLYDTENHQFGPPDITMVGGTTGPVRGSLFVDAAAQSITFVKTGGLLAPDTYTVTLRSAVDGFRDLSGELLDGDGDGVPGGNYIQQNFVVSAPNAVVISVPDFAVGPGQSVNIPFSREGIPLNLSEGNGITAIEFTMIYDPALLTITGVELGDSFPLDSVGGIDLSQPGTLKVSLSWSTPLEAGPAELLRLASFVPSTATYKATNLITFETASLNFEPQSAITDDAVHVVAYIGDTTGNGSYSSLDGQRVLRVVAGLDSGFAAYPLIDPVIIGDVTGNGSLSSLDATRILQKAAGLNPPQIPLLP